MLDKSALVWSLSLGPGCEGRPHGSLAEITGGSSVLEFGTRIANVSYVDRPGAYAIIRDGSNAIALVRTPQGFLLPGGGVNRHEEITNALRREIVEELGYRSRIDNKPCAAVQYLYSEVEHEYFKKVGHFFSATLTEKVGEPIETDKRTGLV